MAGQGAKLASGWLELTVSTAGAEKSILASILPGATRAGDKGGSTIGGGVLAGVRRVAAPVAGLLAGIFTVKSLGALAGMGISRALNIQDATTKLQGLGHSATDVTNIMASALKSVKGTSFGLDAAATIAASAVAAGIKPGQELTKYLSLTADAATIAGMSLSDMGQILNKVAAKGTAYTADLDQLANQGIPIFQWLQSEYGVTATQLSKMVASGQVSSAMFQKAISDNIGGAALSSGKTARGAFLNVGIAVSRLGAMFATPAITAAPLLFNAVSGALDRLGVAVKPLADEFGKWLTPEVTKAVNWLTTVDFSKFIGQASGFAPVLAFFKALSPLAPGIGKFFLDLGKALVPLAPSFGELVTALVPLLPPLSELVLAILPPLVETLKLVVPPLSKFVEGVAKLLSPLKEGSAAFKDFLSNGDLMKVMADALAGKFGSFTQSITSFVYNGGGMLHDFGTNTVGMFADFGTNTVGMFTDFFSNTLGMFVDFFTVNIPATLAGFATGALTWLAQAGMNLLKGLATGIAVGVVAIHYFFTQFPADMAGWLAGAGAWLIVTGMDILNGLMAGIANGFIAVTNWFAALPGNILMFLIAAGSWLISTGSMILHGLVTGITVGFNAVVGFFVAMPGRIFAMVAGAGIWLVSAGSNLLGGMSRGASSGAGSLWSFITSLPGRVIGAIGDAGSWLFNAGKNIVQGLLHGVQSLAGTIGSFFLSLLPNWIVGPFKMALGINSPSKLFAGFGVNIVDGLMGGISSKHPNLSAQVASLVTLPDIASSSSRAALTAATTPGGGGSGGGNMYVDKIVAPDQDPRMSGRMMGQEFVRTIAGALP